MTTSTAPREKHRPDRRDLPRSDRLPPKPDERLWGTDEARAFEAGVRWFLAVSRSAA
jgi:hypothetical protein